MASEFIFHFTAKLTCNILYNINVVEWYGFVCVVIRNDKVREPGGGVKSAVLSHYTAS